MKVLNKTIALAACIFAMTAADAQTLNVCCGNVNYHFDSAETGVMNFTDGTGLTIQGRTLK